MKMKENYEFVQGGKLPGLFGGSVSCGGGANAAELGCFSTRLMWRREGDAELYLYAPYDQDRDQTLALSLWTTTVFFRKFYP